MEVFSPGACIDTQESGRGLSWPQQRHSRSKLMTPTPPSSIAPKAVIVRSAWSLPSTRMYLFFWTHWFQDNETVDAFETAAANTTGTIPHGPPQGGTLSTPSSTPSSSPTHSGASIKAINFILLLGALGVIFMIWSWFERFVGNNWNGWIDSIDLTSK